MFEDLSLRGFQTLALALLAARQRGAAAIEVEDLLVGLVVEDQRDPRGAGIDLSEKGSLGAFGRFWAHRPFLSTEVARDLLARLDALRPRSQPLPDSVDLRLSGPALRALERAASLHGAPKRGTVGPLHLWEAVLSDQSIEAAEILRGVGITRENVEKAMHIEAMPETEEAAAGTLDKAAHQAWPRMAVVIALAQLEAWARDLPAVTVESLLAAVVIEQQGWDTAIERVPEVKQYRELRERLATAPPTSFFSRDLARRILDELETLRPGPELAEEAKSLPVGFVVSETEPPPPYRVVPLSTAATRMLASAEHFREEMHHGETQPLHLLAAIAEDDLSDAGRIAHAAGITRERVLNFVRRHQRRG